MAVDVVVAQEDSFLAHLGVIDVATQLMDPGGPDLGDLGPRIGCSSTPTKSLWRNLAQTYNTSCGSMPMTMSNDLDMAYFEDRSTGGLMAVLNDDVNQLERFLDIGANDIIQVVTTVIVIGAIFFALAPGVAWMALLPMPFIIWGSIRFQSAIAPRYADVRQQVGMLNGQLANNLSGIATIKSYTAEAYEDRRIGRLSDNYRESNRRAISLSSAFVPLIRMVIVLGFMATLVYGGMLVVQGQLNVGAYSTMVFMTQRLLWPLTRLGQTIDLYQRAMASTARVLDLLDTKPRIKDGQQPLPVEGSRAR